MPMRNRVPSTFKMVLITAPALLRRRFRRRGASPLGGLVRVVSANGNTSVPGVQLYGPFRGLERLRRRGGAAPAFGGRRALADHIILENHQFVHPKKLQIMVI